VESKGATNAEEEIARVPHTLALSLEGLALRVGFGGRPAMTLHEDRFSCRGL
jgi:hypothetical protein